MRARVGPCGGCPTPPAPPLTPRLPHLPFNLLKVSLVRKQNPTLRINYHIYIYIFFF